MPQSNFELRRKLLQLEALYDIGRHDDYERAMDEFEQMRHRLIPDE